MYPGLGFLDNNIESIFCDNITALNVYKVVLKIENTRNEKRTLI